MNGIQTQLENQGHQQRTMMIRTGKPSRTAPRRMNMRLLTRRNIVREVETLVMAAPSMFATPSRVRFQARSDGRADEEHHHPGGHGGVGEELGHVPERDLP